jgi:hypothetical protein
MRHKEDVPILEAVEADMRHKEDVPILEAVRG